MEFNDTSCTTVGLTNSLSIVGDIKCSQRFIIRKKRSDGCSDSNVFVPLMIGLLGLITASQISGHSTCKILMLFFSLPSNTLEKL